MTFQKGNKLGGRPKGAKNVSTLLREERRAIFDEEISKRWRETISELRPEYIADQFLGKAPEEINIRAKVIAEDEAALKVGAEAYGKASLKRKLT